jgi:hypothetical protein
MIDERSSSVNYSYTPSGFIKLHYSSYKARFQMEMDGHIKPVVRDLWTTSRLGAPDQDRT